MSKTLLHHHIHQGCIEGGKNRLVNSHHVTLSGEGDSLTDPTPRASLVVKQLPCKAVYVLHQLVWLLKLLLKLFSKLSVEIIK